MFALALARTGFVADRAVFIDDNLPNIEGARAAGLQPNPLRVAGSSVEDLRALGVRV